MAKATFTFKCIVCGKKTTIEKVCYNRKEANDFESYAASTIDTCGTCRAKERSQEQAKEVAEMGLDLPVIEGVSDRQIAYAESLRNKELCNYRKSINNYKQIMDIFKTEEFADACAKEGCDPETKQIELIKYYGFEILHTIFTESSARNIIDALKY